MASFCAPRNLATQLRGFVLVAVLALPVWTSGCASTRKSQAPPPPAPTSAQAANTTIVAIAPPAPTSCDVSIPKMFGLPQIAAGVGELFRRIGSRLAVGLDLTGRFPGLQPQPPLLPITDPANLEADAPPAVQAAAKIKAEEDAAPQKIMAIRYLATLGCGGCYEDVEKSLLEAMSDCTEEVRFEAVKALQCRPDCGCRFCASPSCCSEPVRRRLEELSTCEKEQSARINRVARLALACCSTKPLQPEDIPREGPTPAPVQEPGQAASILGTDANDPVAKLFSDVQLAGYTLDSNASAVMPAGAIGSILATTATSPVSNQMVSGRVLAVVNGQQIMESQVIALLEAKKRQLVAQGQSLPNDHSLFALELKQLIDWSLIHQIASNEQTAVVPASSGSAPALSMLETQAWLERKLAVPTYVSPAEVLAYYQIHMSQFTIPARMRWETLTVLFDQCRSTDEVSQVANFVRARALGQNVQAPEGYRSSMVSVQVGDWQDPSRVSPYIREIVSSLEPGQVSQPFQQGRDLCILRLLAKEPSQPMPMSSVAGTITQEILKQRREAALYHFLAQARANAKIWNALEADVKPASATAP